MRSILVKLIMMLRNSSEIGACKGFYQKEEGGRGVDAVSAGVFAFLVQIKDQLKMSFSG